MNSGDSAELNDKRLVYVYNFLIKSFKVKNDVIDTMMRNREFHVCILLSYVCIKKNIYEIITTQRNN